MDTAEIETLCRGAYEASAEFSRSSGAVRSQVLVALAAALEHRREAIRRVNAAEVKRAAEAGLNQAMLDRLTLSDARYTEMTEGVRQVAALPDPIGVIREGRTLPSGLTVMRRSVPLGVVGVIYESRPNVTVDIAALCLKSANACVLRGGSEARDTNRALHAVTASVLEAAGIDPRAVTFIDSASRESVRDFLRQESFVDVMIPRGGEGLQHLCRSEARMPVITGGFGVSHIFIDSSCDLRRAVPLIVNAKTQKPSACNALDTLLVHRDVAGEALALLRPELESLKVRLRAHGAAAEYLAGYPYLENGSEADFAREFLSLEMNVALVSDVYAAAAHLRRYRASHSDAILTNDLSHADFFCRAAGSACVYVNASTRFTDGGQFGLGAEVVISTQKLHARGPMALEALTTSQYVCEGDYLIRQ